MVKKAYKYRFYPTEAQVDLLSKTFGCVRFVYNTILRYRTDTYYQAKEKVSYIGANAKLTAIKKDPELSFLNDVSSVPLQQCLRNQQTAFSNFFAGRAKYPTFKKKNGKQSAEFTYRAFSYKNKQLFIAKSKEPLNIRWSQDLPVEPTTITITKDFAGRYFVSCLCEFKPVVLPITDKVVGIDVGITDIVITSDGEKTGNPRYTKKYERKLADAQRNLSRKKLGSKNRLKAKVNVARVHAKISDCRKDFLHKQSHKLVNDNQVICVETLRIKNMIKNRKLSKHIADASWGELTRQIEYKSSWYGRTFVAIDQWFPSSKRCDCCGYIIDKLPLNIRSWVCPECQEILDRDVNAANNIKRQGMSLIAFGATVKPL